MFASIFTPGITEIVAKKSRDHTEIMFENLKIPMKINKKKNYDLISISKTNFIPNMNMNIPGDIFSYSPCASRSR